MKKFLLLIFLFFIAFQTVNADIILDIDKERQICLDTNFQSDYIMAQCNHKAIEKYNAEINILLKKIETKLTKEQYSDLIKSQSKWESFIKSDNLLLNNTLENKLYFEPYLISSNIKFQNYKQRYEELSIIYEYIKEF